MSADGRTSTEGEWSQYLTEHGAKKNASDQKEPNWLIDCMVFEAVFNSISDKLRWPMHLSVFFWGSTNQFAAQYIFKATGCFPK